MNKKVSITLPDIDDPVLSGMDPLAQLLLIRAISWCVKYGQDWSIDGPIFHLLSSDFMAHGYLYLDSGHNGKSTFDLVENLQKLCAVKKLNGGWWVISDESIRKFAPDYVGGNENRKLESIK